MNAQFQQVANTYLTRRSLWVVAALAVLSIGIALAVSLIEPIEPIGGLAVVGVAAAVSGYALGLHAKSQFANPRARLLPGFNRHHLAILAAILIAWCGVCPLVVALAAGWSPLGALAASIAGTAAGIWAMHRPHLFTIAPALLVFLSFGTEPTIGFWVLPASTPAVGAARLAIFAIAWGSIAYWFHRLKVLGEEDADYLNLLTLIQDGSRAQLAGKQAPCASGRTLVPGSWQCRFADFFIWLVPASFVPATTTAARQRLLRGGLLARPLWIRAASMVAMGLGILTITAFIGMSFSAGAGLDLRENTPMVGVMIFMTAAMGNGQLATRRARMSQELMLPLRRQDYFYGLFASSAQYAFMIWITTQLAIVAYVALFMPDYFFPGFLAVITALSLGFHMCMFGVQTSIARKNIMFHFVAFMIILFPAASPVFLGLKHLPRPVANAAQREPLIQEQYAESYELVEKHLPPGKLMPPEMKQKVLKIAEEIVSLRLDGPPVNPYVPWACAAVLAAAGVVAFLDARKRWLKLELG